MKRNERRLVSKWKRIAPEIHAHFGLTAEERQHAQRMAACCPTRALAAYRIIAHTLKPWMPVRSQEIK